MKVVIAAGGTGGHINPAIAIGNCLKKNEPGWEILFIGSKGSLEQNLYSNTKMPYRLYESKGLSRKKIFKNVKILLLDCKAYMDIDKFISEYKPDIGVSCGGYISALAMFSLKKHKIPFILHEQNAYPGLTTRILSKYAKKYALAFMKAGDYLKYKNLSVLTGNPIRKDFFQTTKKQAREQLGYSDDEKVVLCFGGSLGAEKLNTVFVDIIEKTAAEHKFRLIIGTGEIYYEDVLTELKERGISIIGKRISIYKYISNMTQMLHACDLAITRSGAMTLSELAVLGKPSVLIPSPNVTKDHQTKNAVELEKLGGAVLIAEQDLTSDLLYNTICSITGDNKKLDRMSKSLQKIAVGDADERIYKIVKEVVTANAN